MHEANPSGSVIPTLTFTLASTLTLILRLNQNQTTTLHPTQLGAVDGGGRAGPRI